MLVKFNVPQAETVVALVDRGAKSAVESVQQLRAFVRVFWIQTPMQGRAELQVLRVVIDQVDFFVARAEEIPKAPSVRAAVTGVIEDRFVLVAVDVHGIVPTGVGSVDLRTVHWIVVGRFPIVGRKTVGVHLKAQHRISVIIGCVVRITEGQFV